MRAPTRMLTPQPPRRRRSQMGEQPKHPNSHTGLCFARPRTRWRFAPRPRGRAQRWPEWMSGCGFPSRCAEERRFWRIRARVCLSDAKRREFSETPPKPSTAGCPQRSEGTQRVGSPFFWVLFFGEAKKSASPAGARPGPHPQQTHSINYQINYQITYQINYQITYQITYQINS